MSSRKVADAARVRDSIRRLARQIAERGGRVGDTKVIGLRTRGEYMARRIAEELASIAGHRPDVGVVDITLYRDDLSRKEQWPRVRKTEIDFPVEGKTVVLVDDVIYTGRSARAAIDAVMDYGRPSSIWLAVLVDRNGRELPIQPDFVGLRVETSPSEHVVVRLEEVDGTDEVLIVGV